MTSRIAGRLLGLAAAARQPAFGAASTSSSAFLSPLLAAHVNASTAASGSNLMRAAWARMPEMSRGFSSLAHINAAGASRGASAGIAQALSVSAGPRMMFRGMSTSAAAFEHHLVTSPTAQRVVGLWLAGGAAWVFSMARYTEPRCWCPRRDRLAAALEVVIGGITRLTRSGLSMTDWKFTGEKAPVTPEDWEEEFAKYKSSPEFKRVNSRMNLEEFKYIFFWEYAHRMWGRYLGVFFAVPLGIFLAKGFLRRPLVRRLGLFFLAGASQGFVGWWMVKSGLEQPPKEYEVPRVSPYRLATHLSTAFAIYTALLWTTMTVYRPAPLLAALEAPVQAAAKLVRMRSHMLAGLIGLTALSGAFVAGMDAGHAYNEFPLMGGQIIPAEYWGDFEPAWRNFFENTAAVQFHHRVLAVTTLGAVGAYWAAARSAPLPPRVRLWVNALLGMAGLQVALGITTLLNYVPVGLGAAHQAGALTLFSIAIALMHSLRRPRVAAAVAERAAAAVSAAAAGGAQPAVSSAARGFAASGAVQGAARL